MNTTGLGRSSSQSKQGRLIPKVLTTYRGDTGCDWVRILHPYKYLIRNNVQAIVYPEKYIPNFYKTGIPDHNIFVAARRVPKDGKFEEMLYNLNVLKLRGKKIVYEIDDDPFSKRFFEHPEQIKELLPHYDAVIASTNTLADRIRPYNPNVHVFRNFLDHEVWEAHPDRRDRDWITIGISGSPTHYDDWAMVADPLKRIAEKHSNVRFLLFGYTPDYFKDLPRMESAPNVPYANYPGQLKRMDIGLAPLIMDDEDFNIHKSAVKVLDYGLAGAMPIASDHPVYRKVDCAKLVKDDEWFDVLDYYVSNPSEIMEFRHRAKRWVENNRLLKDGWRELYRVLKNILKE